MFEQAAAAGRPGAGAPDRQVGGAMGALVRAFDWSTTGLGARSAWPQSLCTAVDLVLHSPVPMVLLWGPDGVTLYNDAYAVFAGARHPRLLGARVLEGWPENADFNAHVMRVGLSGGTLSYRDQPLVLHRHGRPEDVWMNLDYSPVPDEGGRPAGVLAVVVETTARVRAEQALAAERARLEEVFRLAPSFVAAYRGPDHRYAFVNEAYYGLVEHRPVLGRPLDEAIPEAREQGFTALLDRVLATGEPWVGRETPVYLERTPGAHRELRYVDMVFQPLAEADGTRSGVLAHGSDVTAQVLARREVERLLAESECARADLAESSARSRDQQRELEHANQQLQDQAAELEAQAEELQATAAQLEEQIEAADLARAALAESEARYRLAIDAAGLGTWTWDVRTDSTAFDARVRELFAFPDDDPQPRVDILATRVHPDDRERVAAALSAATDPAGDGRYAAEYRLVRPDGAERWVSATGLMRFEDLPGDGGPGGSAGRAGRRPTFLIGTALDVTERKRAEAALREHTRLLRTVAENATLALLIMDERQQCVYMNPAAEGLTGFALDELRGRPLHDCVHHSRPDGTPYPLAECPIDRALPQNEREQGTEVFVHKDGSFYPVAFTASPIRDEGTGSPVGTIVEVRGIARELAAAAERGRLLAETEAARAAADLERRRLLATLEQLPVGVHIAEAPGGRLLLGNAAVRRIWGGAPASARVEAYSVDYVATHHAGPRAGQGVASGEWPMARALATGETATDEVFDVTRPDGSRALVSVSAAPVRDADGRVVGAVATSVDVTERERLLAESEAARGAAESANQIKGQFLANMSHELRTPLNAIGGYVELLDMGLHGPVTAEQRAALGRVQAAQTRLLALINDILNYAKLESGRVEYDMRAVDVADVLRDVAPLVEPQFRAKGLAFDVRLPETPCAVWADREKLGQVLVNLLSNAVKFTPSRHPTTGAPGRVTMSVTARALAPRGADPAVGAAGRGADAGADGADRAGLTALVFLRVKDTGIGIPHDKQDAIFEPFVQVRTRDRSYAQATEGTGLGLAISRDLTRDMGGDLRVRSRQGKGATFTVTLRRVEDAARLQPDEPVEVERHHDESRRDPG